jgi:hypothetical protein
VGKQISNHLRTFATASARQSEVRESNAAIHVAKPLSRVPQINFEAIEDRFDDKEIDSLTCSITKAWKGEESISTNAITPHLQKILHETAQSAKVGESVSSDDAQVMKNIQKRVIQMRTTVKVTKGGKTRTRSALVVVGNGKGGVGFGEGKDEESSRAVMKATTRALKNMVYVDRYDDRTLFHDLEHKFKATKIILRAERPGKCSTVTDDGKRR